MTKPYNRKCLSFGLAAVAILCLASLNAPAEALSLPRSTTHLAPWSQLPAAQREDALHRIDQALANLGPGIAPRFQEATGVRLSKVSSWVPGIYEQMRRGLDLKTGAPPSQQQIVDTLNGILRSLTQQAPQSQLVNYCTFLGGYVGDLVKPIESILCLVLWLVLLPVVLILIVVFVPVALALLVASTVMGFQKDANGDGLGDDYVNYWTQKAGQAWQRVNDFDSDGLDNVPEFRWNTVPVCIEATVTVPAVKNCRDFEQDPATGDGGDHWFDGPEVHYWDNGANNALSITGFALMDPDRNLDSDGDTKPNLGDADSDNDGLLDGDEAQVYHTYPELRDSDCDVQATTCTAMGPGSNLYELREGHPGTGDGLNDSAELVFWQAMQPSSWAIDHDGDGILPLLDPDSDNDGILDGPEFLLGKGQVRPDRLDTDLDGVVDGNETAWSEDTDLDGLVNAADTDSDADGMPDGWEREYGFDMVNPADAGADQDNDGLSNVEEYRHSTIPTDPDTEGDELQDGPEVAEGTDPHRWDTDSDGLPDAWEAKFKLRGSAIAANPIVSDAGFDGDADSFTASWCSNVGSGFSNRAEYLYTIPSGWRSWPPESGGDGVFWGGTQPNAADTDGDGLTDGYEACSGLDPKTVDIAGSDDADQDGLTNAGEIPAGTHYDQADSDSDGLCDGGRAQACLGPTGAMWPGEAKNYLTNPLDPDTDHEGWLDGEEANSWDPTGSGTVPDSDRDGRDNLHQADSDGDGLTDLQEHQSPEGSDPGLADSDGDGLTDKQEADGWDVRIDAEYQWDVRWRHVTGNPKLPDGDMDGLTDAQEKTSGTDPRLADMDGDGLTDAVELQGWAIVVNGQSRQVASYPWLHDSDFDMLGDSGEFSLGTDPHMADTDGDDEGGHWVTPDYYEDEDHDHQTEEGETSPTDSDSDDDGLTDGQELLRGGLISLQTDPLNADSDEDGVSDFDEDQVYHTNPLDADTDHDNLADGEELGLAAGGGSPDRVTNPNYYDSDDDGLYDGYEVFYSGTDVKAADTDCDGQVDGVDPNPYTSNVPPGTVRDPASRACPSAPTGNFNLALADVPNLMGLLPAIPPNLGGLPASQSSSAAAEDNGDVGLLVFDSDGTVTMLARAPTSEAPITAVQAVVWLQGQVRTSASGTLASGSGRITAELQPMDEAGADAPSDNPWTHAVRMALPEGMVEATSATYGLTFVDANLNSATYTGEASGFQLEEVQYTDELNPADQQGYDDPSNATVDGSGWDYVHGNLTGQPRSEPPSSSMALGLPAGGAANETDRFWIYRIVQPAQPALVGALVDGQVVLQAPASSGGLPVRGVIYTGTGVEVHPEDYLTYTQSSWWNWAVKAVKKVVQVTSTVWTAVVQATAPVFNKVGEAVKTATLAVYDEMRNPRSPAAYAARLAIDIVGIGDVVSIIDGVQRGDWVQVGIGAACLAMTVVPLLKGPVSAAKVSLRVAEAAGASTRLVGRVGEALQLFVKEGAAAAPKIERLSDVLHIASAGGKAKKPLLDGVEIAMEVEGAAKLGTRELTGTALNAEFLTKEATRSGKGAAEATARTFASSSQVTLQTVVEASSTVAKRVPEAATYIDDLALVQKVQGSGGVIASAKKMAPAQAKGHVFTLEKVAEKIRGTPAAAGLDASKIDLGFSRTVASGTIRPDAVFDEAAGRVFAEYKNYNGVVSLNKFNKQQMLKYRDLAFEAQGEAHYYIKNGQVSGPFKTLAKEYGIKLFDGKGVPIV